MTSLPSNKDYKVLFRFNSAMSCLHSEIGLKSTLDLVNPLVIMRDNVWQILMQKKTEERCDRSGLDLFSNKEKYEGYANDFREFIGYYKTEIAGKYGRKITNRTKAEVSKIYEDYLKFMCFYELTEYPYHDHPYHMMLKTSDAILKKNLTDLGKLKVEGRKVLNGYVFKHGILANVFQCLSEKFSLDGRYCYNLYSDELLALFDGKKVSDEIIEKRKMCYAAANTDGNFQIFSYEDSLKIADDFLKIPSVDSVKGLVANKGKVKGKVVIALC